MTQDWKPCTDPQISSVIRWEEPIWAAPNKPRGKPDKIGEQRIEAEIINDGDVYELRVIAVEKISGPEAEPLKVKQGDMIRRKPSTIERGNCQTTSSQ